MTERSAKYPWNRFPVYIPSKSRADICQTPSVLTQLGVDWRMIVEEHQYDSYAQHHPSDRLLVLPQRYKTEYDALMPLGEGESTGSGPARNYAWDHAAEQGSEWHWTIDDNIEFFMRFNRNRKSYVGDGFVFEAMESFTTKYKNVIMSGPHYHFFVPARKQRPPFITGSRIFSCNLIRTQTAFRWRGRYNEDIILSLDVLKAGWNTILFNAFLQGKVPTQQMTGGNTEAFYASEGTHAKSAMLVRAHPDVASLSRKFGRAHHHVDFSQWLDQPLIQDPDWEPPDTDWRTKVVSKEKALRG